MLKIWTQLHNICSKVFESWPRMTKIKTQLYILFSNMFESWPRIAEISTQLHICSKICLRAHQGCQRWLAIFSAPSCPVSLAALRPSLRSNLLLNKKYKYCTKITQILCRYLSCFLLLVILKPFLGIFNLLLPPTPRMAKKTYFSTYFPRTP